jgi:hypothetical protein
MIKLLLACAACALVAGCASGPHVPQVELVPEPDFVIDYNGGVGEAAGPVFDEFPIWRGPEGGDDTAGAVDLTIRIIRLSQEGSAELLGARAASIGVFSLAGSDAAKLLGAVNERKDCTLVSSPHLLAIQDQTCTIELAGQLAYIGGFEFDGDSESMVANPSIHTAADGAKLALKASITEDGELDVDFDFGFAEILRPIPLREVKVFNSTVAIQTPIILNQRLTGLGKIAKGRVLALTGMDAEDGQRLLILVEAKPFEPPVPEEKKD